MIATAARSVDVLIPQMGEGIREVTIIRLTKKPGDRVLRDEVLYEMETDKAALEIESPEEGILDEWYIQPGEIASVGSPIARLMSDEGSSEVLKMSHFSSSPEQPLNGFEFHPAPVQPLTNGHEVRIPPRAVAYCRTHKISDKEMRTIPSLGLTLAISDVDAYLAMLTTNDSASKPTVDASYIDVKLSDRQRKLNPHLERSVKTVVSASIKVHLDWDLLEAKTHELRKSENIRSLSEFQLLSYCISRAVASHPKFRSTLMEADMRREFKHINLGFAVALPGDDLITAVVRDADTLPLAEFARQIMRQLRLARRGVDQAGSDTHLTVSYLAADGVIDAQPVLVLPAAGTLFVGAPYPSLAGQISNLVLAFDHRSINGIGAANFLNEIKKTLAEL